MDILYKLTTDRMTSYIVSAQIFLIYIAGEEVRREKLCISLQMTSVWNVTSVQSPLLADYVLSLEGLEKCSCP